MLCRPGIMVISTGKLCESSHRCSELEGGSAGEVGGDGGERHRAIVVGLDLHRLGSLRLTHRNPLGHDILENHTRWNEVPQRIKTDEFF